MPGRSSRIGRIAGIPVGISASLWRRRRYEEWMRSALTGLRVADVMSRDPIAMPIDLPARAATALVSEHRHVAFPITDPVGWPVGLLRLTTLEHVTDEQHYWASVAELADTDPGLVAADDDDVASLLDRPAFRRVGRAAVVGRDGRLVGVVSASDLARALRTARLSARAAPPPGLVQDC